MHSLTKDLKQDFGDLLKSSNEYNVIIEAGEEPQLKKFKAHSIILRIRSPHFERILSDDWDKRKDSILTLKKPNIAAKIFEIILEFIYTGVVDLKNVAGADILQLLIAADELDLLGFINYGQAYLIEKESKWLKENIIRTIQTVSNHANFEKLWEHCSQVVEDNPGFIRNSIDFLSLEESALVSLLQTCDFKIKEIEVWQSLIKWGIGKTPRLFGKKLMTWDSEDFAALEKTIHQCIPLIRYYNISGDDYFKHILPYKKILPKNLKKEILAYHVKTSHPLPMETLLPRARFGESRIIDSRHVNIISSWIDKKTGTMSYESPYNLSLIYRGSRDGFEITSFRNLCGNQLKTVVIGKITESGDIVGGYNPTSWVIKDFEIKKYANTPDAFIFNLGDRDNFYVARVARNTSERQIAYRKTCIYKLQRQVRETQVVSIHIVSIDPGVHTSST
ncbi:hypothetical protein G9A89_008427 [Geosiphon pyriformis]|nr:hypothetical protein G9A89_008427 [Geosiphon pyriformis]